MQTFRNIVSSFTRTGDGKHPPDEVLQQHRDALNGLRDQITQIRQQFTTYTTNLIHASESGVLLSKSVTQFYQAVEHSGTVKSVQTYNTVNEEIANSAVKVFQEQTQLPEGLIAELDNWLEVIKLLEQEIEDAERARAAAQSTSDRLHTLKEQHERLKKKQQSTPASSSSGINGVNQQELRDLEERINDTTNVKKSLTKDFQDQKQKISDAVANMFKEKYRIFDRVYVQLLECQLAFINSCNELIRPFKTSIDYYRKQYPKTYADYNSHPLHQSTHQLLQHSKLDFEHGDDVSTDRSGSKLAATATATAASAPPSSALSSSSAATTGTVNPETNGKPRKNTIDNGFNEAAIANGETDVKAAVASKSRNNSVGNKNADLTDPASKNSTANGNNTNSSIQRNNRSGTLSTNNSVCFFMYTVLNIHNVQNLKTHRKERDRERSSFFLPL
ncbi:hypothetical protein RFI_01272 [Reticulomyxa filosa]|uniref:BAR domain-containing protein n=1 Tax=Reticulomyxa filosa TaxID=46433 RepID=X6PC90_RETFI|nr:hypothetical protein RFI_01272 [Reticulomyxa filosa]|eukprot:ETO35791.1 hypothetical protein RFI_01272 [Reticulomyxa filosa]